MWVSLSTGNRWYIRIVDITGIPFHSLIAFPEGLDISFDTPFLRHMASSYSSQERTWLSTVEESQSSESLPIPYSFPSLRSLTPPVSIFRSPAPSLSPTGSLLRVPVSHNGVVTHTDRRTIPGRTPSRVSTVLLTLLGRTSSTTSLFLTTNPLKMFH